jgi:hypothetical protein
MVSRLTPRTLMTPATLVAGTAVWLVPVRAHESGAAPGTGAWLAAGLLALTLAALLVPSARRVAGEQSSNALEGALVALAGAVSAAAGMVLFAGTAGRSLPAEAARDLALAMAATAPLGLLLAVRDRAIAADPETDATPAVSGELVPVTANGKGATRRSFLKVGGGAVATAALVRLPATAAAAPPHFVLTITEGDIHMIDDVPVFFRTFAGPDGVPQIPGPAIGNPGPFDVGPDVLEGQTVRVNITNLTARDHTFLIERTDNEAPTDPVVGPVTIPKGGVPVDIEFTAPQAGTYIYRDADRNNRLLGMHGVMVVMPADGTNRPYSPAPGRLVIPAEFLAQYTWMLHDIDPLLGELARSQSTVTSLNYPLENFTPRYFTINGKSGSVSTENLVTIPVFPVQDDTANQVGALIRVVNTGGATHSPHWHGNHVFLVEHNAQPAAAGFVRERDIVHSSPLSRNSVLLPIHTGLDAWPPLDADQGFVEQAYPMHCHAEMSQTAAGGLYPMGMLCDWRLVAKPQAVAAAKAALAAGTKSKQAKAQIARVVRNR